MGMQIMPHLSNTSVRIRLTYKHEFIKIINVVIYQKNELIISRKLKILNSYKNYISEVDFIGKEIIYTFPSVEEKNNFLKRFE